MRIIIFEDSSWREQSRAEVLKGVLEKSGNSVTICNCVNSNGVVLSVDEAVKVILKGLREEQPRIQAMVFDLKWARGDAGYRGLEVLEELKRCLSVAEWGSLKIAIWSVFSVVGDVKPRLDALGIPGRLRFDKTAPVAAIAQQI